MSQRVAVFVDGENISAEYSGAITAIAARHGTPDVLRVYGNACILPGWPGLPAGRGGDRAIVPDDVALTPVPDSDLTYIYVNKVPALVDPANRIVVHIIRQRRAPVGHIELDQDTPAK